METSIFLEWMSDKFLEDGFIVKISISKDEQAIFHVIIPEYPHYQTSRAIPENVRPIEMGAMYFDIATSIRKLERYADEKSRRMARE